MKYASVFSQLLGFFDRTTFARLARQYGAERYTKGFSTWTQFVAMLFCHLAQAKSLREICGGLACTEGRLRHLGVAMAPNKSTLSYANEHRPAAFFEALFYETLAKCRTECPQKHPFRFKNKLLSFDASVISLCLTLFPWAKYRRTKGAVKLHLLLDHDGYLPTFALITEGKMHEVRVARQLVLAPGSIVAMDRAFNDYALFGRWTRDGVYFVTRLKEGTAYEVVEDRPIPNNRNILSDRVIRLTGDNAREQCPYELRLVVVWDEENNCEIRLLTNHLQFGATTISAIYKDRWQIEPFFKALKQNLKVKTFVGTSENALRIQIWTALIAILLLKFLKFRARFGWSLSNLVTLLRMVLFTYRDLWAWLDKPFDVEPSHPGSVQYQLFGAEFGQHPAR